MKRYTLFKPFYIDNIFLFYTHWYIGVRCYPRQWFSHSHNAFHWRQKWRYLEVPIIKNFIYLVYKRNIYLKYQFILYSIELIDKI